jgi:hypothetical protein
MKRPRMIKFIDMSDEKAIEQAGIVEYCKFCDRQLTPHEMAEYAALACEECSGGFSLRH